MAIYHQQFAETTHNEQNKAVNTVSRWLAVRRYKRLLERLQQLFSRNTSAVGMAAEWSETLRGWVSDLPTASRSRSELLNHVIRTRRAFGGMGSLNDVPLDSANEIRESLFETANILIANLSAD